MIRILVVDDEPPARRRLLRLLGRHPDVEVIGSCATGKEALHVLEETSADVLLLDVKMPEMDGFSVLEGLVDRTSPLAIFVTAFEEYAIKAFEYGAFDYLMKPYDEARFDKAIRRAVRQVLLIRNGDNSTERLRHQPTLLASKTHLKKVVLKSRDRVQFLDSESIDWIQVDGKMLRVHCGPESFPWRGSLSELESQLDPKQFVRVHRSTVINVDRIKELQPLFHGEYVIIMLDGTELRLSRRCRPQLELAMGRTF